MIAFAILLSIQLSCSDSAKQTSFKTPERKAIRVFFNKYVDSLASTDVSKVAGFWFKPLLDRMDESQKRFFNDNLIENCRQHRYLSNCDGASTLHPMYRLLEASSSSFTNEVAKAIGSPLDVIEIKYEIFPNSQLSIEMRILLVYEGDSFCVVEIMPPKPVLDFLLQGGSGRDIKAKFPEHVQELEAMEEELKSVPWAPLTE